MTAKDLIFEIASEMNQKPENFQKFVDILDENFLITQQALCDLQNEDWKELRLPLGISSQMKKKLKYLSEVKANQEEQSSTNLDESTGKEVQAKVIEMVSTYTQTDLPFEFESNSVKE